jgi:two-component system, LytTR family, sensor kinase
MTGDFSGARARRLYWIAQLGGWTLYGISHFLTLLPALPATDRASYLVVKLARAALGLGASLLLHAVYRELRTRRVSAATFAAGALGASTLLGVVWLGMYRGIVHPLVIGDPPIDAPAFSRSALDLVFALLGWSAVYFGAQYWKASQDDARRARDAESREREARHLARDAQLRMLSYQLNPHFLFNALNSLREMIAEDRPRAQEMVTQLAGFLRYSLDDEPTRLVTLDEEIDVVRDYLAIESIRFESRLEAMVEVERMVADCVLPRFLIHPLVENAIKHGSRDASGVLRVRVVARSAGSALQVEVSNTGSLRKRRSPLGDVTAAEQQSESGIGWSNVRSRLQHVYVGSHRFVVEEASGWVTATLTVPQVRTEQRVLTHA